MKAFDEYGGWDNPYPGGYSPLQLQALAIFPMKMKIPGVDLPNDYMFQLLEEEVMKPEDYDRIFEMGCESFCYEDFLWRITNLKPEELSRTMDDLVIGFGNFLEECAKRETKPFFMGYALHPFFMSSLMRSMVPFT